MRKFALIGVRIIPAYLKRKIKPSLKLAFLDALVYLNFSSFNSRASASNIKYEEDVYFPPVPIDWLDPISRFKSNSNGTRILVVLHVFYFDLVPQIFEHLNNISEDFDLIITNSNSENFNLSQVKAPTFCHQHLILTSLNLGRDLGPLIGIINSDVLNNYELVLKIHTKKSEWRDNHDVFSDSGSEWRERFLSDLLGSEEKISSILNSFRKNPSIGLITAQEQLLGTNFWAENRNRTSSMARMLYIDQYVDELIFPAGSMYWCRPIILASLTPLNLTLKSFEPELAQTDGTLAHALERLIGLICLAYDFKMYESNKIPITTTLHNSSPRIIAYYLPQFYPIPENNLQWGEGFTEWTNVTRARPQFPEHVQPVLPQKFGFYDLRLNENVIGQEEHARAHGISGFCYYYYNFGNREVMADLLRARLSRKNGLPFNILWVNESWTRAWDGSNNLIIQRQTYPDNWVSNFFYSILPLLLHGDYLKDENGQPILSIYRPLDIPQVYEVTTELRKLASENGLPGLFILGVRAPKNFGGVDYDFSKYGLDGTQDFPPHGINWVKDFPEGTPKSFHGQIFSLRKTIEADGYGLGIQYQRNQFPGLLVGFDNTPRRGSHSYIISDTNPFTFRRWLEYVSGITHENNPDNSIIFVNAWNEWAETSMLEPNSKWKNLYLMVVKYFTAPR